MKKKDTKKLLLSLFSLISIALTAQNSSVDINLKPNSGTTNQIDTDVNVSNNLEAVNFNASEITCITTTSSSGEVNYSFTWLGSDFDKDGDNDELNFDLVVGSYVGSTYTYDGAVGSMTNLGSLSNTTFDYNNTNINGWGVSDGDVGPGETLKLEIKNLVISGVSADYQISFDGFQSADIYETNGGYAHAMVLGEGDNLETYKTNLNKTFSFDAIETLLLTGAGSNVANREWAVTNVNFSFSVINAINPNYWNIHDYSDFKTASTYGEAYPDQQKEIRQPTFSWNKIPRWLAVRNTETYTEEQIEAMAKVDILMLEKANDAGLNSIEEGISATAARVKAVNPDSTVLFYWNSVINYGGYEANKEYELNKDDWSLKNDDGSIFMFKDLYYNYDYELEGLREWWVNVPVQMAQDPNIDGVFYDKLSKVQSTDIYDDAGTPVNNHARMLQDSYNQLPEGKITLGNALRNEWVAGNRDLMTVFDGSYLERWDLRNKSTTQTQADAIAVSIQLMREALAKGKLINIATHPSHNFLEEPGTDIYGETISVDPPTDPDELLQYMKDNIHFPLAVFLIAAEEGAYFSYNLGVNAHPNSDDYWDTGFIDELNYYVGPPLGDPVRNGYLYTRSYENVNVSVNLETKETVLDWIDKTRTESTKTNGVITRIEAEDYDRMSGIQTEESTESGDNVGYIHNGDWLRFDDVNLSGFSNIDVRVASKFTGGTIEVRSGSTTGTLLGSISITNTGGDQEWVTESASLSNATGGTADVYLVFTGGNGYLFNVNWIEFNFSTASNKNITDSANQIDVLIYPNPIDNTTTIVGAENSVITIYDINGRGVFVKTISNESEALDLNTLSSGIYYAKVSSLDGVSIMKLIKE